MSGTSKLTIDQLWDRLVTLARKAGATRTDDWQLVAGAEYRDGRDPWLVTCEGETMMTLGYTRREVEAQLLSMNTILAVVLGA